MSDITTNTTKLLFNVSARFDGKNLYAPGNPNAKGEEINVLALDLDGDGAFDMKKDIILAADSNHDSSYTNDEFTSIATPEGLGRFAGGKSALSTEDIRNMGLTFMGDKNGDGRIETVPSRGMTFLRGLKNFINEAPVNKNLTGIETIQGVIDKSAMGFTAYDVEINPSAGTMKETRNLDETAYAAAMEKRRTQSIAGMGLAAGGLALMVAANGTICVPIGLLMFMVGALRM
jgi:hypothetical protein